MTNSTRQARWRDNHRNEALAARRGSMSKLRAEGREAPRKHPRLMMIKPFIALDGEGAGTDELHRQNYQLLRAGDALGRSWLCLHDKRLSTASCLDAILLLPKDAILVGYFFGYDVTQILRDLPFDRMNDLFIPKHIVKRGKDAPEETYDGTVRYNKYTYWESYGIEYVPKQYFRVCRIDRQTCKVIKGTARTINEVGGFFQKAFVEAIKDWDIEDEKAREFIARMKDMRSEFSIIGDTESKYCQLECVSLAKLMTKFRKTCAEVGIVPRHWRGAGHIAARLHEINKTPTRYDLKHSRILDRWAEAAYYGGRFEITTIGAVNSPVWEYDINSAYPAAMLQLPCPFHGRWKRFRGEIGLNEERIYIADISFRHPDRSFLCGFPIRENGRLYFPKMGSGIYWSPEIRSAAKNGANVTIHGGYHYIKTCDCHPFEWVRKLYDKRMEIGRQTLGYPIKLGLNGLYGKFAQRIGARPWQDYIMAGLITSFTRAKLIDAYAEAPNDILYLATDALYSRRRLRLDTGPGIGQWGETVRNDIFIVQPGIYWSSGTSAKPKTRGIPRSIIIENRTRFETEWAAWLASGAHGAPPIVPVFVNQFIGLRAALARNKPHLAGSWLSDRRKIEDDVGIRMINFDWDTKRRPYGDYICGECMVTQPLNGHSQLRSQSFDGTMLTEFNAQLIEREDDPDFIPWGNTGE